MGSDFALTLLLAGGDSEREKTELRILATSPGGFCLRNCYRESFSCCAEVHSQKSTQTTQTICAVRLSAALRLVSHN